MGVDFGSLQLTLDPFENFSNWMKDAEVAGALEPTAMTLATASKDGRPSARIVLYKGLSRREDGAQGFCLFTNYGSRKSHDLMQNGHAALVFFWPLLNRQVRVEGVVERLSDEESDRYFASRPRGSRIGAWASPQSQKISSREELLAHVHEVEARFGRDDLAGAVPRPTNWGGWLLIPQAFEFWQAGEFRLHDRFRFEAPAPNPAPNPVKWSVSRLAP